MKPEIKTFKLQLRSQVERAILLPSLGHFGVISMIEQEVFILVRGRKDALCHFISVNLDPDSRSFPKLRCTKYFFLTIAYCWSNNSLLLRKNT